MKSDLTLFTVQPQLIWEGVEANLEMYSRLMERIPSEADLVVLPETFSTGFTMNSSRYAEDEEGKAVSWLLQTARSKDVVLTGSLIIKDGGRIFNRFYWVTPEGIGGKYDKRHLFRMGRENESFVQGNDRPIFNLGPFRVLPQICYDLRFPVFSRNQGDYDLLINVANWPAPRHHVWEVLIRARAMENQAYVVAVNRVGVDGEGVDHAGGTCAVDPKGEVILRMDDKPGIGSCTLSMDELKKFREAFPVWKDADGFSLELS